MYRYTQAIIWMLSRLFGTISFNFLGRLNKIELKCDVQSQFPNVCCHIRSFPAVCIHIYMKLHRYIRIFWVFSVFIVCILSVFSFVFLNFSILFREWVCRFHIELKKKEIVKVCSCISHLCDIHLYRLKLLLLSVSFFF